MQDESKFGTVNEAVQALINREIAKVRAEARNAGFEAGARAMLEELHRRDREQLHDQHQRDTDLMQGMLAERSALKPVPEAATQPVYSGPMSEAGFNPGLTLLLDSGAEQPVHEPRIEEVRQAVKERSYGNQLPLNTPIEQVLDNRWIVQILQGGGIYSVGQLLDTSSKRFSKIPRVSRAVLQHVDQCLAEYGLARPRNAEFEVRVWQYMPAAG